MKWFLDFVDTTESAYTVTIYTRNGYNLQFREVIFADEHAVVIQDGKPDNVRPKIIPWTTIEYLDVHEEN